MGSTPSSQELVPAGSATFKVIDEGLKRCQELTHFADDGDVPISNNWLENRSSRLQSPDPTGCPPAVCGQASALHLREPVRPVPWGDMGAAAASGGPKSRWQRHQGCGNAESESPAPECTSEGQSASVPFR
nr:IS66 family transposase [Pseudacidovorax sp. NFM-22]